MGYGNCRYEFRAYPAGTHWYHSHAGQQLGDGCSGPVIVRQSTTADHNSALYDEDQSQHVMVIADWEPVTSHDRYMALMHDAYRNLPMSALINGRARLHHVVDVHNVTGSMHTVNATTPMHVFHVQKDLRYRFRLISVAQKCPFRVFFDNHTLQVSALMQLLVCFPYCVLLVHYGHV